MGESEFISTRGYEGPAFASLPGDLGDRVRLAATFTTASGGAVKFSLDQLQLPDGSSISREGTDFFLADERGVPFGSVHTGLVDGVEKVYRVLISGIQTSSIRTRVQGYLGLPETGAVAANESARRTVGDLLGLSGKTTRFSCQVVRRSRVGVATGARRTV